MRSGEIKRLRLTRFRVFALAVVSLLATARRHFRLADAERWTICRTSVIRSTWRIALRPVVIPDHDNAYSAYAEARIARSDAPTEFWDATGRPRPTNLTWSKAKPDVRAFQENNRAALEIWREGSERPDALYHQPSELAFDHGPASVAGGLPPFRHGRAGGITAGRAGGNGARRGPGTGPCCDRAGWSGRHGVLVERQIGAHMHELAARCILRWAADPRVDAEMLHRALDDVLGCGPIDAAAVRRLEARIPDGAARAGRIDYLANGSSLARRPRRPARVACPHP